MARNSLISLIFLVIISDFFHNKLLTLLGNWVIFVYRNYAIIVLAASFSAAGPGGIVWQDVMLIAEITRESVPMTKKTGFSLPQFHRQIIAIVGGFGSGKTEVAVNLAKYLAVSDKEPVSIVDLDLVNPYFRSREAIKELEKLGVKAVAPRGGQFHADLPILLPEVKGAVENPQGRVILDIGGDSQGTKALGSLSKVFIPGSYDLLMVINTRRPATSDFETTLNTMLRIEASSQLDFTGLISNSHLIDETDMDIILEGYNLTRKISRKRNLPLKFVSVKSNLLNRKSISDIKCAVLPLSRSMLKPWERPD